MHQLYLGLYASITNALITTTDRPEKTDFVRMATMMDALIVPFAAVGMAESLTTIADGGLLSHALSASDNKLMIRFLFF